MSFQEMALRMFPYWIMGLFMLYATYQSSHRDLLRVDFKATAKWILFLGGLTLYRYGVFKLFSGNETLHDMTSGAAMIPWQATLTVFWEDMCHTVPLVILSRWLGNDKMWKKVLTWGAIVLVMLSFGLGHVYQGYWAALFLSFYIPFTYKKGQEVGFGTVMICHTLYDLVTILSIQAFLE
ncbi:MAG: hypothetical protein HC840_00765 [Leptolyngbyaceae cyanobacterium RM2_2_4]|nr:hypothetical protein [Leptolyngbyaceae cyanobacterium RM2_2_4]